MGNDLVGGIWVDFQLAAQGSNRRERIAGAQIAKDDCLFCSINNLLIYGFALAERDAERNHAAYCAMCYKELQGIVLFECLLVHPGFVNDTDPKAQFLGASDLMFQIEITRPHSSWSWSQKARGGLQADKPMCGYGSRGLSNLKIN